MAADAAKPATTGTIAEPAVMPVATTRSASGDGTCHTAAAVITAAATTDPRVTSQARLPSGGRAFHCALPDGRQGGARRDHFLREPQLQERRRSGSESVLERRRELLGALDELAGSAERARVR